MEKRLIGVSKYLAKYLRHAPQELGLTLEPGGWVSVDELLVAADKNGFPISYDELVDCVETIVWLGWNDQPINDGGFI